MFLTKFVEKIKTHVLSSVTFIRNSAINEIMWKNTVKPDSPQIAIYKHTIRTHNLIVFPRQQWLRVGALC